MTPIGPLWLTKSFTDISGLGGVTVLTLLTISTLVCLLLIRNAMESVMPLFRYSLTLGSEIKTIELRKSNPQGWLLDAVQSVYPEIASRHAGDIMRLRLTKDAKAKQTWHATFVDGHQNLKIQVMQIRS